MINWWQVYYWSEFDDRIKAFGFCSIDGVVHDHPDYTYRYMTLSKYKLHLLQLPYVQVVKIC